MTSTLPIEPRAHRPASRSAVRGARNGLLSLLLMAGLTACDTQTQSEDAHVHGEARLTIAIDEPTSASLEFSSPAESIYGFEHEATTAEDISARDAALETLESRFLDLLGLPADLGCSLESAVVEVVSGDEHADEGDDDHADEGEGEGDGEGDGDDEHADDEPALSGEHSEVRGLYLVACSGELEGNQAQIALGNVFGGIQTLNVTVLSAAGQRSVVLERGSGTVDL